MKYERPAFMQEGVPLSEGKMMFVPMGYIDVPKIDYPITPLENFKRAAKRKEPMWVPNFVTEFNGLRIGLPGSDMLSKPFDKTVRSELVDEFGVEWVWVPGAGVPAGGPMHKPGVRFLDDILDWEKKVVWPNFKSVNWAELDDDFMNTRYDPAKITHMNLGLGMTERLVGLLGGLAEAMIAMAEEPDAVCAFFERFTDYMIEKFDILHAHYHLNFVTIHDDWGTEKDTFFSERMMEDMVLKPTKRLFDHIHSKDVVIELHCCGRVERFIPYMIEMGVDFLQLQTRANDVPALKAKYGDKIGFWTMPEIDSNGSTDDMIIADEAVLLDCIRKMIDAYAKGGGMYTTLFAIDEVVMWNAIYEAYCYSREYYDREYGR